MDFGPRQVQHPSLRCRSRLLKLRIPSKLLSHGKHLPLQLQ
ncbi:hypothetical protein TNCV_5085731 [Trichonephila clavipes]|uniref:Uncharacterized protein n=1 Tax=Trichonephila clavipes TaxID=2585209 RepID=A0A8X6VGW6_TRICX|nr:hypothetical protein TNCV_5085731 [Trichonephila clavipes]